MRNGVLYDLAGNELCEVEYTLATTARGAMYGTLLSLDRCLLAGQSELALKLEDGTKATIRITDHRGATFRVTHTDSRP